MKAVAVVRHIVQRSGRGDHARTNEVTYRAVLVALASVYRADGRNQVDQAIRGVIACEKDVHHLTEDDFLEAVRIVFQPVYPIVYPDQFRPVLIIDPDGKVLWMVTTSAHEAPLVAHGE